MAIVQAARKIKARVEHITGLKQGQWGEYRSVLFIRPDKDGDNAKVWRSFKPHEVSQFQKGQTVNLIPTNRDGRQTWDIELIDTSQQQLSSSPPEQAQKEQQASKPVLTNDQKVAIAAYVDQMADLYAYCFSTASTKLDGATEETVRAAASSLFISTQRKFDLS